MPITRRGRIGVTTGVRICPNLYAWQRVFEQLKAHANSHRCVPRTPPTSLILAGWAYSNDKEKMQRWEKTLEWANMNDCAYIVSEINDTDFYFVENPTEYEIGPLGGPTYLPWSFETKTRPPDDVLDHHLRNLGSHWQETVGEELGRLTRPEKFTGRKARCLLVRADALVRPPWGEWNRLSAPGTPERRNFTHFRAAINRAISPHEIDHVDFAVDADFQKVEL